jgi:hypothetical protein
MYALSSTLDPIHREADVDAARFDTVVLISWTGNTPIRSASLLRSRSHAT